MTPPHDFSNGEDDQLWIGWKWFEFHAKQRLEIFKFFLTIVGTLVTVSSGFLSSAYPFVATMGSVLSLGACVIFWLMDRRSRRLTEIGEDTLSQRWQQMGFPLSLDPVRGSREVQEDSVRFKHVLSAVFIGAGIISGCLFVASIVAQYYPLHLSVNTH